MTTGPMPRPAATPPGLLSPGEVAQRLGSRFAPTAEQSAIIAAPLEPAVVIAGAGSGKTETMAARVVWLVANGLVQPERVLGLTFTRKAAGELQQRVRSRLHAWHRSYPLGEAPVAEPTVLTYAAYAARLVDEHGMLLGAEPGSRLLSEAARWQVADAVVRRFDGSFSVPPGVPASVTGYLLDLAGQLADHLVDVQDVGRFTDDLLARLEELPLSPLSKGKPWPADLNTMVNTLLQRRDLIPLLDRFAEAKRAEGAVDFSDHMVMAARLARLDTVSETQRSRFDVVLLDEYQDTGHAQIEMLASLFADGRPVTAVGDPLQSIYGWRGASASNIRRFTDRFRTRAGLPAPSYALMTSWRNDRNILLSANHLASTLRTPSDGELVERAGAGSGRVVISFAETEPDEAQWIAERLRAEWDERRDWIDDSKTLAVLVRKRSIIGAVALALQEAGLPVEVVDLGGLITLPEIADVVATLRVLVDHSAGGSLARLLTGARWRIGPADLVALQSRARQLARMTGALLTAHTGVPAEDEERVDPSLVEALDDLGEPDRYSAQGYRRMHRLAGELRRLRRRLDLPLPDLIDEIQRVTGLDIEVAARPTSESVGRANLDRFCDEAARFASERAIGAGPVQIAAFLGYLAAAEDEEYGLKPAVTEVHSDRVQVLTIHGAKGLEWDVVAIAGMYEGGFPSTPKTHNWTRVRALLPSPLRGDGIDLPPLVFEGAADRREADKRVKAHHAELGERFRAEERRLAYVALTRSRRALYCSGARWGNGKTAREPSAFLVELAELSTGQASTVQIDGWQAKFDGADNPLLTQRKETAWPRDPVADRPALSAAAELVRAAGQALEEGLSHSEKPSARALLWRRDVELLLAERAAAADQPVIEVVLPDHLSASQVVELSADEQDFARRLRRPLPQRPAKQARRGTAFHSWLEQRWSADTLLDIDELPGAVDEVIDDRELERLKAVFEASEWAARTPVAVEVPFEMTFGARVVRGRMDAVFAEPGGRYTVVDWKTGQPPRGSDAAAKAVQLALYRLAWARLNGISDAEIHRVGAAFHYVPAGLTVAPADLLGAEQLRALLEGTAAPD
ncbi:MAG: ATP-dependent helicase UvrD/PcrA [Pseudonocardiales bacterium]|jgi:DNA helicase-2/ATP-dependent DNA helicase PcrA|nr:ATP-dependent helicase UvrD/PcrA [Pseudonocardiales bacterium]